MFLPISKEDMKERGWESFDFLYVIGEAYVDHPSFGHAIISRVLEDAGFKVAILSQPDWRSKEDFLKLGRPRLGVLLSSGNIDSMVNHYTAAKKLRHDDAYSPGGKAGMRPDRCVIVYANRIREAFGDIPLIIGGVEASLRRFAHYDYWDDRVRRSVLVDSRADILVYGMGERQLPEIAQRLNDGWRVRDIRDIDGTAYLVNSEDELPEESVILPTFEEVRDNKRKYADSVRIQYEQTDAVRGKPMVQKHQERYLVQNKPAMPLSTRELDKVYALPYERNFHPSYTEGVPAITEVKFSVTSSRGCFGNCNFCALAFHQGRVVTSRSHESIIAEANKMVWEPDFKGYIHDVGGPTANFRHPSCEKQMTHGVCKNRQCLYPSPCKNMKVDHKDYLALLRKLRALPGVKKVFVRSGIRFDYLMADADDTFFRELVEHHISGQLKVAPEHISDAVLSKMGKPENAVYERFVSKYKRLNEKLGKNQGKRNGRIRSVGYVYALLAPAVRISRGLDENRAGKPMLCRPRPDHPSDRRAFGQGNGAGDRQRLQEPAQFRAGRLRRQYYHSARSLYHRGQDRAAEKRDLRRELRERSLHRQGAVLSGQLLSRQAVLPDGYGRVSIPAF